MAAAAMSKRRHKGGDEAAVRRRILQAAFTLFRKSGYATTSMLEIATRARVSKRELYALVGNKQQMLIACISERANRLQVPADLPEPMRLAAHLSHYALYALMIGMPLLGWGMLSAGAYPVVVFGSVYLPAILPQSDALHTWLWAAHFYLAFAFFALVLMHLAAALFHALVRHDGVFDAMAFGGHKPSEGPGMAGIQAGPSD